MEYRQNAIDRENDPLNRNAPCGVHFYDPTQDWDRSKAR